MHETFDLSRYIQCIFQLMPILILIFIVLGSIYTGIATPTEGRCRGGSRRPWS